MNSDDDIDDIDGEESDRTQHVDISEMSEGATVIPEEEAATAGPSAAPPPLPKRVPAPPEPGAGAEGPGRPPSVSPRSPRSAGGKRIAAVVIAALLAAGLAVAVGSMVATTDTEPVEETPAPAAATDNPEEPAPVEIELPEVMVTTGDGDQAGE